MAVAWEKLTLRRKGGYQKSEYNFYNPDTVYEAKATVAGGTQAPAPTYKYYLETSLCGVGANG
jgi:hypothetical protein